MSLLYDLYQSSDSWLHRLDPRTKLLLALCASAFLLLMRNVWIVAAALLLTQAALWSAHISWKRGAWAWRLLLPTMIMITVLWVVVYPGEGQPLLRVWLIRVTQRNLAQGAAVALRLAALAFTIFLWLFSTDQAALVRGLVSLGLPYAWGLTLAMALRYLPTMANLLRLISEAQQARALDLSKGNPVQRARAYLPIIVAMIITALRTAENLSRALESRALGARQQRTYLHALRLRRADWAWIAGILLITTALVWARLALGLGADPLRII